MAKSKVKDHRGKDIPPLNIFWDGDIIDYQTVIEENVGDWLSKMNIMTLIMNEKKEINGKEIERDRAYFVSDGQYQLTITKIS